MKAPFVSDNTMKILKALFVSNNKMKRFFFLLISYHRLSVKAWETLFGFWHCHEDFDCTEIDCLFRTDICLSNDSESVVLFLQQKEALFISIATKCSTLAFHTLSIRTQWESFRSQPTSILALSHSETSLISLNLRLQIIKVSLLKLLLNS